MTFNGHIVDESKQQESSRYEFLFEMDPDERAARLQELKRCLTGEYLDLL